MTTFPAEGTAQTTFVLEVAGAGGFVGTQVPEVIQKPLFRVDAMDVITLRTDSTRLIANSQFLWKPAVSTGIVGRWVFEESDSVTPGSVGIGVGFHMVALPGGADASIRLAPALTLHFGSRHLQWFGGVVFTGSDEIRFPTRKKGKNSRNGDEIAVVAGTDPNSFVLEGIGYSPTLFLGITIGGISITEVGGGN